jgi:hypothetical protein
MVRAPRYARSNSVHLTARNSRQSLQQQRREIPAAGPSASSRCAVDANLSTAGAVPAGVYKTLRTMWWRLRVYGRTSVGHRPISAASTHALLESTSGLSIS